MNLPLTLVVSGLAALALNANAQADEWNKQWQVSGHPELHVVAGDASVSVEVGSGNEIEAVLRTRGVQIGNSGVRVTEHQNGNRVDLEIREPSNHFSFGIRSVELTVHVPRETTASVHTGDGSIKLRGLHGSVNADTGDGSIQADELDGMFDAHTGDGSLHVHGRFDNLQVRTSDGSVEVEAVTGSHMRSDWRVETGDGSVRLQVPRDLAADLQVRTGDGSIHVDLPLMVNGSHGEHETRGKMNGGGPLLDVKTGDGSVSVSAI